MASPWNFPLSIPAGGVLAALAAGNAVILKPAPESVADGSGAGRGAVGGRSSDFGAAVRPVSWTATPAGLLITQPEVDAVVLTGAWETARRFLGVAPGVAPARRDEWQERHGRHRHRRPGRGHRRPGALGLRPRRAEVFCGQPGHRRSVGSTTTPVSWAGWPTPCAACGSVRPGPGHDHGAPHPPTRGPAAGGVHEAGPRGALVGSPHRLDDPATYGRPESRSGWAAVRCFISPSASDRCSGSCAPPISTRPSGGKTSLPTG